MPRLARFAEMKVTRQQMKDARVPLMMRDYCAHLLIPLNQCRAQTWYSPWKCQTLRHGYEECEYNECAAARLPSAVSVAPPWAPSC